MSNSGYPLTIPSLFNQTLKRAGDCDALAFVGDKPMSYRQVSHKISALIAFLEKNDLKHGDKIAILSTNMPNWGIAYYAITFMGAVAVPILPDFSQTEVNNVITHSEAVAVFVSSSLVQKIESLESNDLKIRILMDDFSLMGKDNPTIEFDPSARPSREYTVNEDDLASIIYTSGTTGRSKGVMLSHRNITLHGDQGRKHP